MHNDFVDWFRIVHPDPSEQLLKNRWAGVEEFGRKTRVADWIDCVRLFVGLDPRQEGFEEEFVELFKKHDAAFTAKGAETLLQVLSGSALMIALEGNSRRADAVSLAVVATRCGGIGHRGPLDTVFPAAKSYLTDRSSELRNVSPPDSGSNIKKWKEVSGKLGTVSRAQNNNNNTLQTTLNETVEAVNELVEAITQLDTNARRSVDSIEDVFEGLVADSHRIEVLKEELDILWWLFGGYSRDLERPRSDIGEKGLPIICGRELANLVRIIPGPPLIRAVLNSALKNEDVNINQEFIIAKAIEATPKGWRDGWLSGGNEGLAGGLSPVLEAVRVSVESKGDGDWQGIAEARTGVDPSEKLTALALSEQIYFEIILVNRFQDSI